MARWSASTARCAWQRSNALHDDPDRKRLKHSALHCSIRGRAQRDDIISSTRSAYPRVPLSIFRSSFTQVTAMDMRDILPDADPQETREWLEALESVLERE